MALGASAWRIVWGMLDNALIEDRTHRPIGKCIRRRSRLGGLLNYYERAA
jgi:hypothetical protein